MRSCSDDPSPEIAGGAAPAAWVANARRIDEFECDAAFRIEPSVYIGPNNDMTSLEWATANVSLPPVDLPRRFADRVTTAELLGREDALIGHYHRIAAVAAAHGKTLRAFPYFRTQPAILAVSEVVTEFSWTDTVHKTREVLEVFARSSASVAGLVHDDQDQGWHILIAAAGATTCFIEWDGEGPPPNEGGYAVEAAALARQAAAALHRLHIVHDRLVRAFGRDYWA